ncbi:MAG: CBS domain-containing protein [Thermoplasmatota archaeon]
MEKVEDLMTKDVIVAELPGNRRDVINSMVKNELTGMPVVKDGKLKGFVSRHDFFAHPDEDQLVMIYRKNFPSISKDESLKNASKIFVENEVNYLPVVGKDAECVGILTTADMLKYLEELKVKTAVGDAARSPCIPIYEETPIKVVLQTMKLTGIYAFPVVNKDTLLTGIITDRDLFNLSKINGGIVISELGLEQDEDEWSWQGLRNIMKLYYEESKIELPDVTVKDAMVKEPKSVFHRTEVYEVARIMRRNDYGQLPIIDEKDKLQTMVYELDILATIV